MVSRRSLFGVVFLSLAVSVVCRIDAANEIVRGGMEAPGGGQFATLNEVAVPSETLLVFSATLNDGSSGLYASKRGRLVKLVGSGATAPGTSSHFERFFNFAANESGDVVFRAELDSGRRGIFLLREDGGHLLASQQQQNEEEGFVDFLDLALSADGRVAFCALLSGGPRTAGLYVWDDSTLERVGQDDGADWNVQSGDLAGDLRFDAKGRLFFTIRRKVGPVTQYTPVALFSWSKLQGTVQVFPQALDDNLGLGREVSAIRSYALGPRQQEVYLVADAVPPSVAPALGQPKDSRAPTRRDRVTRVYGLGEDGAAVVDLSDDWPTGEVVLSGHGLVLRRSEINGDGRQVSRVYLMPFDGEALVPLRWPDEEDQALTLRSIGAAGGQVYFLFGPSAAYRQPENERITSYSLDEMLEKGR